MTLPAYGVNATTGDDESDQHELATAVDKLHLEGPLPLSSVGLLGLAWIDNAPTARTLVEADLRIVWANMAARAALARRRDLENRSGILSTVVPNHQPQLQEFVLGSGVGASAWWVPRTDGDGHVVIKAQRIDWSADGIYGIEFFGTGKDFDAHYAPLDKIFGLTVTEHKVLMDLLGGSEAAGIAKTNNVLIATVRSQIKSIYQKMAVNSREALFRRAAPYRLR